MNVLASSSDWACCVDTRIPHLLQIRNVALQRDDRRGQWHAIHKTYLRPSPSNSCLSGSCGIRILRFVDALGQRMVLICPNFKQYQGCEFALYHTQSDFLLCGSRGMLVVDHRAVVQNLK